MSCMKVYEDELLMQERMESVDLHRTVDQLHEQLQCRGLEFNAVADENERLKSQIQKMHDNGLGEVDTGGTRLGDALAEIERLQRERDALQARLDALLLKVEQFVSIEGAYTGVFREAIAAAKGEG